MARGRNRFDALLRALRRRKFGTLSTLGEQGRPHATAVIYAISPHDEPVFFYVTTRTTTRKVRNIRTRPDVAFVVFLTRLSAPMFPPRAVQFQGTAEVVAGEDEGAVRAFQSSWFLRRILSTERRIVAQGGDLCFIRIRPDPVIFTYGIGMTVFETMRRPKDAAGRVVIPADRLPQL